MGEKIRHVVAVAAQVLHRSIWATLRGHDLSVQGPGVAVLIDRSIWALVIQQVGGTQRCIAAYTFSEDA